MTKSPIPAPVLRTSRRTVLVLQGGGALGAYQAGVFEGLAEAGLAPDWVAGVSIGAINASLIAGNPVGRRIERLHAFWSRITASTAHWPRVPLRAWQGAEQKAGAAAALLFGQPGFFRPHAPLDWLRPTPPVSYYDTAALRATLEELVDFDLINAHARHGTTRLSVGAVQVESGNMVYFDSKSTVLGAAHVMASGALPPGLAMVEIDGAAYWDGGLVSNTPLQYVVDEEPRQDALIFQVDLFPARGPRPTNLDEAGEREIDIRYSSRTRSFTDATRAAHDRRRRLHRFLERLPPDLRDDPAAVQLRADACPAQVDVVHLIYHPQTPQGAQKDFQFDRASMERRWRQGKEDARQTVAAAPWQTPAPPDIGLRTFDVLAPAHRR